LRKKVLERLATSDKTTIVIERQADGKMRVTSNSWGDEAKVFMRDRVLELRVALPKRRLHVARKTKHPDQWDPPIAPYDPWWSGRQR
jgi:hypothetical protein